MPDDDRPPPRNDEAARRETSELLRRISLAAHRYAMHVSRRMAVPPSDVHAMGILAMADEPLTASTLGSELGLSKPAVSAMLQRLTAAGHLERGQSEEDGRRAVLTATDAARAESASQFGEVNDAIRAALAGADPADVGAFLRILEAVADELDNL